MPPAAPELVSVARMRVPSFSAVSDSGWPRCAVPGAACLVQLAPPLPDREAPLPAAVPGRGLFSPAPPAVAGQVGHAAGAGAGADQPQSVRAGTGGPGRGEPQLG